MGRAARERAAKAKRDAFTQACHEGDVNAVARAIEEGADVNACGSLADVHASGRGTRELSPLIAAGRHEGIIAMLLEAGADIDMPIRAPRTGVTFVALSMVAGAGALQTCRFLLDRGAAVDGPAGLVETPLHTACRAGHVDIVAELLKRGADHKLPDADGRSALIVAMRYRHADVVEFLNSVPRLQKSKSRRSCMNCGKSNDLTEPTFKVCARCRSERYCSRACQAANWRAVSPYLLRMQGTDSVPAGALVPHRDQCIPKG